MPRRRNPAQLSLLDWTPPAPVAAFDPALVRGNSFAARLSRAISVSLDTCGRSRDEIAAHMGARLERAISINVLNAYASPMRDTHQISVPRFDALLHATGDRRLIEFIAAEHDWAVIDRRHLPLIELAALADHKQQIRRQEAALRREARGRGAW